MELERTGLVLFLEAPSFLLPPTQHLKFDDIPPNEEDHKQAIHAFIKTICQVQIDDIAVVPIIRHISYEKIPDAMHLIDQVDLLSVYVEIEYPIKAAPDRVSVNWDFYLPEPSYGWGAISDPDQDPQALTVQFAEYGRYNYFILSPSEPGFTWHAPEEFVETNTVQQATLVTPLPRQPFPTLPLSTLLAGGLVLVVVRTRGAGVKPIALIAIATLSSAAATWYVGKPQMEIPQEKDALRVFESLHQNIYRAFDYVEESDIYDALAQSVDGPLLDRMYSDIYQSLILRDEGGAMCRIESVDILSSKLLGTDASHDTLNYQVECLWDVLGKVSHWGHAHERRNRYAAIFQLEPRGEHWRICSVQVNRQERIEEPAPPSATKPTSQKEKSTAPSSQQSVWDLPGQTGKPKATAPAE